jgi:hypothetical protein
MLFLLDNDFVNCAETTFTLSKRAVVSKKFIIFFDILIFVLIVIQLTFISFY